MGLDLINQHVTKILLAIEEGDSINQIYQKINVSYSYTHEWIQKLIKNNIIERKEKGIYIKDKEFQKEFQTLARNVLSREIDLENAYLLPNYSNNYYRYTKTDAIYIWTKGGYQIGRSRNNYPIFVNILKEDLKEWKKFFNSFNIKHNVKKRIDTEGIYFVLYPQDNKKKTEWVENARVQPLKETIKWAKKYEANFQPALEMLDKMYELNLDTKYRERGLIKQ